MMRITVELDENQIDEVSRLTGVKKKSPAIAEAIQEFIRQKEREAFLKQVLAGETDYQMTNEQIEQTNVWDETTPSES